MLRAAYGRGEPVDYSDWKRRVAYLMHYAPKHAVIWRQYAQGRKIAENGNIRLNSVGTGPGSEIIGWLEGTTWRAPGTLHLVCLEAEEGWREILEIVLDEYQTRAGRAINNLMTNTPANLMAQQRVIGSFVLSDLGRQDSLDSFVHGLAQHIGPARGLFLDAPAFRDAAGDSHLISQCVACGYTHLPSDGFHCMQAINDEMDACDPIFCYHRIVSEPSLNVFRIRFETS